jgi:predicted RNase H-like HicB family nuclease
MKYLIYKEEDYYVAQCLNVDVSSFGSNSQEAIQNLKEAVELYLEDEEGLKHYHMVGDTLIGEAVVNA